LLPSTIGRSNGNGIVILESRGAPSIMICNPSRSIYAACAAALLWGASGTGASTCGAELAQELQGVPYRIVFESYQDQNWDLFAMRADGSERVNLTRTPDLNELCPHVSSDGKRLLFVVDKGEGEQRVRSVWCMNVDGTGRQRVAAAGREPCWCAGDQAIAYLKPDSETFTVTDYATKGLVVHDLASGQEREHPNPDLQHLYNLCSTPDGKWYLSTVHAGMGYSHAIVAIEALGPKVFRLGIPGCRPDVSPDGKRIAWASGDFSLAVGDLDFSGPEPRVLNAHDILTSPKPMKIQHIDWSPDGRYVAFSRGPYAKGLGAPPSLVGVQAPRWNICVADPGTTNRWVSVTTDGKSNKEPDWAPLAKP
jgi:dipeptidyl aminopeptidase/acylaminoacyl peptidase